MTDLTGDRATYPAGAYPAGTARDPLLTGRSESAFSGVSWAAIIAGGVGASAMATILVTLGAGLGLIAISPWHGEGASATTVGIGVIIWSIVIQIVAFGLGGYLAGRLRTKWANIHSDEVYFRDTAHGFVTWALGSLVSIAIVGSAIGHIGKTAAEIGATAGGAAIVGVGAAGGVAGGMAMNGPNGGPMGGPAGMMGHSGNPMDYYIDMLFRPAANAGTASSGATTGATTDTTNGAAMTANPSMTMNMSGDQAGGAMGNRQDLGPVRAEIGRIVRASLVTGDLTISADDKGYIASQIAQRTGLSQQEAEKRIDTVVTQAKTAIANAETKAKQAADDARKAAAGLALWSFVAMLIGAFAASYAATIGGRQRDL